MRFDKNKKNDVMISYYLKTKNNPTMVNLAKDLDINYSYVRQILNGGYLSFINGEKLSSLVEIPMEELVVINDDNDDC